jgi:Subtilase family/Viral BACON domain
MRFQRRVMFYGNFFLSLLAIAGIVFVLSGGKTDPVVGSISSQKPYDRSSKQKFFNELNLAQQQRVIKLKRRWILPGKEILDRPGDDLVFLQFSRRLSLQLREVLAGAGVYLGQSYSGNGYKARVTGDGWKALKDFPDYLGAAGIETLDKMDPGVAKALKEDRLMRVALMPAPGVQLNQLPELRRYYGRIIKPGNHLLARLSPREIGLIVAMPEVAYLNLVELTPIRYDDQLLVSPVLGVAPQNEDAADMHNVDVLLGPGYLLSGTGVNIQEIDGGTVRDTHEALTGRVTNVETDEPLDDHATHVAGTMIGSTPEVGADGMAPGADLYFYDFDDDLNGADPGTWEFHAKMIHSAANYSTIICNNSWGFVQGWDNGDYYDNEGVDLFGLYYWHTSQWDAAVVANPEVVVCKAAGNDRNDYDTVTPDLTDHDGTGNPGGWSSIPADLGSFPYYDCITAVGNAKNLITVGAVDDGQVIASFSSTGPANDGRIKPDLVANGISIKSCLASGDTAYGIWGGTSMSTPVVSGICALLAEAWANVNTGANPGAMITKALLVHTAVDLGPAGPDYIYGFGLVDAQAAVDLAYDDNGTGSLIKTGDVNDSETDSYTVTLPNSLSSFSVTLTWLDPAGAPDADPAIVHDLDLELQAPGGGTVYYPFSLNFSNPPALATATAANTVDTVEKIIVASPASGDWTVRVTGTDVASAPQSYVLVWDNLIPAINLSTDTISLSVLQGQDATSSSFGVSNSGGGVLNYSIADNQTWLSQTPTSGTADSETDTISVDFDTDALTPGIYNATITISDPAASNNSQTIAVQLTVIGPEIQLDRTIMARVVTVGKDALPQFFNVSNSGGGTLDYTITENSVGGWLLLSSTSGTALNAETDRVDVTYQTSALPVGNHAAIITVSDSASSNNPQTIAVTITVNPRSSGGGGSGGCALSGFNGAEGPTPWILPYAVIMLLWGLQRMRRKSPA